MVPRHQELKPHAVKLLNYAQKKNSPGAANARLPSFRALFFLITPEIKQKPELVFRSIAEADDGLQ